MRSSNRPRSDWHFRTPENVRSEATYDAPVVQCAQVCRLRCALRVASVLAPAFILAVALIVATSARAERWYGQDGLCMDLDSVRIIDGPGSTPRLVAFRMGHCGEAEVADLWSIDLEDCSDAKDGGDGIILYRYTGQGTWNLMSLYDHDDRELRQAAVACNWAAPRRF